MPFLIGNPLVIYSKYDPPITPLTIRKCFIYFTGEMGAKQHFRNHGTIPSKPINIQAQYHRSFIPANRRIAPTITLRKWFQSPY